MNQNACLEWANFKVPIKLQQPGFFDIFLFLTKLILKQIEY